MICSSAIFFLFLLGMVSTIRNEFEKPKYSRSLPFEATTPMPSSLASTNPYFRQKHEGNLRNFSITEETYVKQKNGTLESLKNETLLQKIFKSDLMFFFKEVNICRESHSYMSNEVFKQKLYCFLLNELNEITKENSEENFHCNISKKTLDQLKGMQHLQKIFKRIFILNPKNDSCGTSREQATGSYNNAIGAENLKLKLGDEWIHLKPKVSHLSHIYLGPSIYPILTEESWVIEKDYTPKNTPTIKSSYTKETGHNKKENDSKSQTKSATKIYQLLTLNHRRRDKKKNENKPRFSRSFHAVRPKSLMPKDNLKERFNKGC